MYTSEIRETDADGRVVVVSPALLARVREADAALREWLRDEFALDYAGRWSFPEAERAALDFQVRLTDREAYTVSLPFDRQPPDGFAGRAVDAVLARARGAVSARLRNRVRDLIVLAPTE
jgi:hypothetical protein